MGLMTPPSKSDFFKQTTLKRLMVIAARADIRASPAKPSVCSGLSDELAQAVSDLAQRGGLGLHSLDSPEHGRHHRLVKGIRLGTLSLALDSSPDFIESGADCLGVDRLPRSQHQVGGLQVAGENGTDARWCAQDRQEREGAIDRPPGLPKPRRRPCLCRAVTKQATGAPAIC